MGHAGLDSRPRPHRVAGRALFAILFVWQFPLHGYRLLYRDDYARAGIRMFPSSSRRLVHVAEALFFAVIMIP